MDARINQKGMTLVEVMVAAVILALVMIGVILSASHTQRSTLVLQQKTQATWVANNVSAELRAGLHGTLSSTGSFQGKMNLGTQAWYWSAKAQPLTEQVIELVISVHESESMPAVLTIKTGVWRPS